MIQNPKNGLRLRDANPNFPSCVEPAKTDIILSGSSTVSFLTNSEVLYIVSEFLVHSVHGLQKQKRNYFTGSYGLSPQLIA